MRNHVRAHFAAVAFRILRPAGRRFSIHGQYEERMMGGDVGVWVVCPVLVTAYRDNQVSVWICAQSSKQFFERYPTNLSWTGEVGIAGNCERRLGQSQ